MEPSPKEAQIALIEAAWQDASARLRNLRSRLVAGQNQRGELFEIKRLRERLTALDHDLTALEALIAEEMA